MSKPVLFYGKPDQVDDVVTYCTVKFLADGTTDETQKSGYLASLFRGSALSWLTEYLKANQLNDYEELIAQVRQTFGLNEAAAQGQYARQLAGLRQKGSVQQYAITFQDLARKVALPDAAAKAQFVRGLKPHVQRGLIIGDDKDTLNAAITEATRIDSELYSIGRTQQGYGHKGRGQGRDGKGKFRSNKFKSEN